MPFGPNELRNATYLNAILGEFRRKVDLYCAQAMKGCASAATEKDRFDLIKLVRDQLKAMPPAINIIGNYPMCDPGMHCEGGVCLPDEVNTGWPPGGDPTAWNMP